MDGPGYNTDVLHGTPSVADGTSDARRTEMAIEAQNSLGVVDLLARRPALVDTELGSYQAPRFPGKPRRAVLWDRAIPYC